MTGLKPRQVTRSIRDVLRLLCFKTIQETNVKAVLYKLVKVSITKSKISFYEIPKCQLFCSPFYVIVDGIPIKIHNLELPILDNFSWMLEKIRITIWFSTLLVKPNSRQ